MTEKTNSTAKTLPNSKKQSFIIFSALGVMVVALGFGIVSTFTGENARAKSVSGKDVTNNDSFLDSLKNKTQIITEFFTGEVLPSSDSADGKKEAPKESVFSNKMDPIYLEPVKIFSNDFAVNSYLEKVGVEDDGALGVPQDWQNGGWYTESAKTGEDGNIIVDGHYDTNTGAPAAFWDLKNARTGDTVILEDKVGRQYVYEITDLHYVDIQDSNRIDILNQSQGKTLTLVTCGGVWLPGQGTYNKRLIVKAKFIDKIYKNNVEVVQEDDELNKTQVPSEGALETQENSGETGSTDSSGSNSTDESIRSTIPGSYYTG